MFFLKSFVVKSAAKLAEDVCYPEDVMGEFKNFEISSVDHILPAYNLMLPIIKSFSGDPEKFYPQFYKTFSSAETIYKSLCGNCSLLLSFVVTNHVLALLTGVTIQEDVLTYDTDEVQNLSEKDLSLISYLGGCFWNIYRRICCSTKNTGLYSQQCLSFLMDGKCVGENVTLPEHRHVNIMDRAGLWKLNENIKSIWYYFRIATKKHVVKIDSKSIVSNLMANATAFHHATILKIKSEEAIKKELALNLLFEDLLTLYMRVRSFSFVNDQQQAYKI